MHRPDPLAGPVARSTAARAPAASRSSPLDGLPGPPPLPLLGNVLQLDLPRLHRQLEDWAQCYGPVYRLRLGRQPFLCVADGELIATILRGRPHDWRRFRALEAIGREIGAHGVFSAEGADWLRQRRMVMQAFDPKHLKAFFPYLVRTTERLRKRWLREAEGSRPVPLQAQLMRYTVDVVAGLALGADVNTVEKDGDVLQDHLDAVFPIVFRRVNSAFPYWRFVRLPSDRAFDRHLAHTHALIGEFVAAARRRMQADRSLFERPGNLLEAMLAARESDGRSLSEAEVAANVFTVLLAGEDTTANTLAWTLWLLHGHRDVWRALVEEVDEVLGEDDMPRSFDGLRELEHVEACVNESMRLRPVAPLLYLEACRDTKLGDLPVPAGMGAICVMRKPATDPARVAEPQAFRPDRWRGAEARGKAELNRASMPFGAGPRLCPGRYLALLEMKMLLAMLARNFDLVEVAGEDGAPPAERLSFTMYPVGLRMQLSQRRRREQRAEKLSSS